MIRLLAGALAAAMALSTTHALAAGAIAVDDEEGVKASEVGYGVGTGASRDDAAKAAMAQCVKAGNANCQVVVRYDTCGAYAGSSKHSGVGWGDSKAAAEKKALSECGEGCRIVVSACDD